MHVSIGKHLRLLGIVQNKNINVFSILYTIKDGTIFDYLLCSYTSYYLERFHKSHAL